MNFESVVGVSLSDILKAAGAALLPVLIVYGKRYLSKFLDTFAMRVGIDHDKLRAEEINGIVEQAVAYVEQRYVRKEKEAPGGFDEAEAFDKAAQLATAMLSKESLSFIARTYKNAEIWLHTRIELEVKHPGAIP